MGGPEGPGWPNLPGGFDLSQMFRMLQSEGPVNWEVAGQVASWTAVVDPETGEAADDPAPGPEAAEHLDGIARAAQTHAASATGLPDVLGIPLRVMSRREWASGTLDALHPVVESLASGLARSMPGDGSDLGDAGDAGGLGDLGGLGGFPMGGFPAGADPFAGLMAAIGPVVVGVQAGTMIGFLAQQSLGQYDLPLPLTGKPRLVLVAANIDAFAEAWSLPPDDLRFALALREAVHAAQRSVPWVRDLLVRLSSDYVGAYRLDPSALEDQLGGIDLSDPTSWGSSADVAMDPAALLDAMRTDEQAPMLAELQRFASVLEGYTDTVVDSAGEAFVQSLPQIDEALRRHRVERGQAEAFVDRLLGLELGREHYERGVEFCRGVVERAGTGGLNRLWTAEAMVPTAAELDAPGLWLARIDLDA